VIGARLFELLAAKLDVAPEGDALLHELVRRAADGMQPLGEVAQRSLPRLD